MSRQYRFLALSTIFTLSTLIFFVALFGAEPANADLQQATADAEGPQGDVERGRYLAQVAGCGGCHGTPDLASGGPPPLAGGREFNLGPLGEVYAPNLTMLQDWTFEEFDMALRQGIEPYSKRTLLPAMPYMAFHRMSDADIASIGAYLKSLTPVPHDIPAAELSDAAKNLKPLPQESIPSPTINSSAQYGRYLVEAVANCGRCHSPRGAAQGREYSGGTMNLGDQNNPIYAPAIVGPVLSAQGYSRENFAATMRLGIRPRGAPLNPQMPWRLYADMTDNDLTAMWNFLQTKRLANPWPVQTPPATRAATAAATTAPAQAPPVAATEDTAGPVATETR